MRIDAHQHFWVYSPAEYPWLGKGMEHLRRDFLPADLEPLLRQHGLDGSVAVQARQSLEETRWLLELADRHASIAGVVGWVDLRSADLEEQLQKFTSHPKFVGVRHVAQDEVDDRFLARDEVIAGVAALHAYGLVYDLLIYPRQLPAAIQLVAALPAQTFVLDHLAKPLIRERKIEPWASQLRELASHPNVACKLSGIITEADWLQWRPEEITPYLDVAREAFGWERLLYGSDWPVCLAAGDYAQVFDLVDQWSQSATEAQRASFFGQAAERWYRLSGDSPP
jgi:L-fuconolactonase